jgi:hypothetical protein
MICELPSLGEAAVFNWAWMTGEVTGRDHEGNNFVVENGFLNNLVLLFLNSKWFPVFLQLKKKQVPFSGGCDSCPSCLIRNKD